VDMRKSFDSLAEHVRAFLGHDPLSGNLFVFRGRRSTRLKILWWDKGGLAIYYKRLERGEFQFPPSDAASMPIAREELARLLAGLAPMERSGGGR
jgi:transposase